MVTQCNLGGRKCYGLWDMQGMCCMCYKYNDIFCKCHGAVALIKFDRFASSQP